MEKREESKQVIIIISIIHHISVQLVYLCILKSFGSQILQEWGVIST